MYISSFLHISKSVLRHTFIVYVRGSENSSINGQRVNILGFAGPALSIATTLQHRSSNKKYINECACVKKKIYVWTLSFQVHIIFPYQEIHYLKHYFNHLKIKKLLLIELTGGGSNLACEPWFVNSWPVTAQKRKPINKMKSLLSCNLGFQ